MPAFAEVDRAGDAGRSQTSLSASASGYDPVLCDLKPKHTFCFGRRAHCWYLGVRRAWGPAVSQGPPQFEKMKRV